MRHLNGALLALFLVACGGEIGDELPAERRHQKVIGVTYCSADMSCSEREASPFTYRVSVDSGVQTVGQPFRLTVTATVDPQATCQESAGPTLARVDWMGRLSVPGSHTWLGGQPSGIVPFSITPLPCPAIMVQLQDGPISVAHALVCTKPGPAVIYYNLVAKGFTQIGQLCAVANPSTAVSIKVECVEPPPPERPDPPEEGPPAEEATTDDGSNEPQKQLPTPAPDGAPKP